MLLQVHFDCIYRGVTALSSHESKLLAGNRIIAQVNHRHITIDPTSFVCCIPFFLRNILSVPSQVQPYEFKVGSMPGKERKRNFVDNANGLFSAQAAPKPPPAMYSMTEGMRVGGTRKIIVPSEFGYGQKGMNEIPVIYSILVTLLQVVSKSV